MVFLSPIGLIQMNWLDILFQVGLVGMKTPMHILLLRLDIKQHLAALEHVTATEMPLRSR